MIFIGNALRLLGDQHRANTLFRLLTFSFHPESALYFALQSREGPREKLLSNPPFLAVMLNGNADSRIQCASPWRHRPPDPVAADAVSIDEYMPQRPQERRLPRRVGPVKSTLEAEQKNLTAEIPCQIAEYATHNWRHIAGPDAHAIRIGESWTPAGLDVPNANAVLDELSGGEAEQVAFATRLALATQLAQKSRQLAVFDDAFLATDPTRAKRVLELLATAAEKLQIIVLTCHPARYRNLPDARHFDLEKLKQ